MKTKLPFIVPLLALGTFLMCTTEYIVAGLLEPVAVDFGVPTSQVGLLITAFAVGQVGWRGAFWGLAVLAAGAAVVIGRFVPVTAIFTVALLGVATLGLVPLIALAAARTTPSPAYHHAPA